MRVKHSLGFAFLMACTVALASGCASVNKNSPHMGFGGLGIEAGINRQDIVVLDAVEGTSTQTSILGPLYQVVDNDPNKVVILGIRFFEDKTAMLPGTTGIIERTLSILTGSNVAQRAYYEALAATPDADAVFLKSATMERSGIPLIYETKRVTYKGKAVKLKAD